MQKYIGRTVLIGVSLGLLWLVLRNVSWVGLSQAVRSARPGWVGLAVGSLLAHYILRAVRWQRMLRSMNRRVPLLHVLIALLAGSLSGLLLPGAGELMRLGTVQRTDGVPISEGLGSLVAERSFDVLMMLIGIVINAVLLVGQGLAWIPSDWLMNVKNWPLWGLGLLLLAGLLLLIATLVWRNLPRLAWIQPFLVKLQHFRAGFVSGLVSTWQSGQLWPMAGLTVMIWLVGLGIYGLIFKALPASDSLPVLSWLTVNSFASISGLAVPTQGGIGSFHLSAAYALALFGVDAPTAGIIVTFFHAVQTVANLLLNGLGVLLLTLYINPLLVSKSNTAHESSDTPSTQ